MQTIQQLAEQYKHKFENKKRSNGDDFLCLSDDITSEHSLYKLVRQAHSDMCPDDYKYQYIYESLVKISEIEGDIDIYEIEVESDIYNSDLLEWVRSNFYRIEYCNQVMEDGNGDDFMEIIRRAQHMERAEILFSVYKSLLSIINE